MHVGHHYFQSITQQRLGQLIRIPHQKCPIDHAFARRQIAGDSALPDPFRD